MEELGLRDRKCNIEGSELPIAGKLLGTTFHGQLIGHWTRSNVKETPDLCWASEVKSMVEAYKRQARADDEDYVVRPAFTLQASRLVDAEGNII